MNHLPGPAQQPYAPQAGQPHTTYADQQRIDRIAEAFTAALDEATATPTAYKDPTPVPAIGTAPPVPQPGRAPMGQAAVDYSARVLSTSVAYAIAAGSTSVTLWATHFANPKVIALLCAAPPALAVPILAACALAKRAKQVVEAAPPQISNHYSGNVYQDQRQTHINTKTVGVIAYTRNQTPELPPANH